MAGDHGGGIYFVGLRGLTPQAEISYNILVNNTAEGQEHTGNSGGGIWLSSTNAHVHHNTIVQNTGGGSYHVYGGGIAVAEVLGSPLIEQNIIAYTLDGGGIRCDDPSTPVIRNNLAWDNVGGNGTGDCKDWALSNGNIVADPMFCGLAAGDLSLAADSPAITHPAGPLGAIADPGCPGTPVERTTWGRIKARYE